VGSGTFGYITNFNSFSGSSYTTNGGNRQLQASGRISF
jgi:hypothetical protein